MKSFNFFYLLFVVFNLDVLSGMSEPPIHTYIGSDGVTVYEKNPYYYHVLGVKKTDDATAIKKEYLIKSKEYHANKFPKGSSEELRLVNKIFNEINNAKEMLLDTKRSKPTGYVPKVWVEEYEVPEKFYQSPKSSGQSTTGIDKDQNAANFDQLKTDLTAATARREKKERLGKEEEERKAKEEAEAKRKAEELKKAKEEVLTDEKIDEIFGGLKSWSGLSAPRGDWVSYIESLDDDQRARLFVDRLTKASKSEAEPIKEKINSGAVFIKDPKFKQVSFRIKTLIDQSEEEVAQAEKARKAKEKLEKEAKEVKKKAEEEEKKKVEEEAPELPPREPKKGPKPTPVTITEEETPPPLPPRDEPKTKSLKASLSNLRKSLQELKTKIELLQGKLVLLKENLS